MSKLRISVLERVRRIVRSVIGWDSLLYRLGSQALNLVSILYSEGLRTTYQLSRLKSSLKDGKAEAIQFARLNYPFYVRPGTKDISVVINNFIREEYAAFLPETTPKTFVDGGAFIGDTSAYFLSKYPDMHCMSFEPMPDSFAAAKKNLGVYGDRVELLPMAITVDGQPIQMAGQETGAHTCADGDIEVSTMTIEQILEQVPDGRIDILKLDIEGAEGPIFANEPERWLSRVGFIIVETHGREVTDIVLGALQNAGWAVGRVRNLYFCHP